MKIVLLIDCYEPSIGGVITSVKSLKESLTLLGHEVYIITLDAVPKQKETDPNVIRLNGGIPLLFKGLKDYRLLLNYKKHLQKLKELNLDIIHIHTEAGVGHLGIFAAQELNLPLIYTMHSMYHIFLEKNNFFWIKLLKKILLHSLDRILHKFISASDFIIVPTEKTLLFLQNSYSQNKKYEIIPTGLKLQNFDSQKYSLEEINILKNKLNLTNFFICLFVGRLSKEKDINLIIDNFAFFHEQNKKSKFVIIGDGPEKKSLQKKVKKLNLQDKIIFLGFVPNDQTGLYYQLGDVFLNASLFETQGLTFIEALSASLPVVARYDEALKGVVEHGKNGFFYQNEKEFVQILNNLISNKTKYKEISLQAKESIKDYKQEVFGAKMIDIYKKAIEENKRSIIESYETEKDRETQKELKNS
ncbi:glycosyltransferase ['Camptotheca acuminata' phytoplasma]|uniref:glycosyltransferase n=1 Tax='Camptotheca acuminata' phytoplasma TaxID=3239192 RepID=UPI00351A5860